MCLLHILAEFVEERQTKKEESTTSNNKSDPSKDKMTYLKQADGSYIYVSLSSHNRDKVPLPLFVTCNTQGRWKDIECPS